MDEQNTDSSSLDVANKDMKKEESLVCKWIGNGEGCRHPTIRGKSYCEKHYDRVYSTMFSEMANYIINKELKND